MPLKFPISLAGKRGGIAAAAAAAGPCQYQGHCEPVDTTTTYLFAEDCSIIKESNATALPQSWGANTAARNIHIGSNLTDWGNSLFRNSPNIEQVYIPATATNCGIYAFWGATNLHTVTFGGMYHSIGSYSFRYCNNLTRVNFCSPVPPTGLIGGSYGTFVDCPNLTEVHVPENGWGGVDTYLGLTVVRDLPPVAQEDVSTTATFAYDIAGNYAYGREGDIPYNWMTNNDNVYKLEIGPSCTYIAQWAFRNSNNIGHPDYHYGLTIPGNVTEVATMAFWYSSIFGPLVFEEGVQTIGDSAFEAVAAGARISDLVIPSTVTYIGAKAFYESTIGLDADGNNTNIHLVLPDGLTYIGNDAFADRWTKSYYTGGGVHIPDSVTYCGAGAFRVGASPYNPKWNGPLYIGSGVPDVGGQFARSAQGFTSITFGAGSNLQTIGNYAFEATKTIRGDCVFPDSLTTIGTNAFRDSGIDGNFIMGSNLTSIGSLAFAHNWGRPDFYIASPATAFTGTGAFGNTNNTQKLYVTANHLAGYDATWASNQQCSCVIEEWTSYPDPMP